MIEITFLGTGSAIPSKTRNHPAIALEYYGEQKETMLWDCGEGTQKRLMEAGISFMKIDKIFITHWHADHFAGLIPLRAFAVFGMSARILARQNRPLGRVAVGLAAFIILLVGLSVVWTQEQQFTETLLEF